MKKKKSQSSLVARAIGYDSDDDGDDEYLPSGGAKEWQKEKIRESDLVGSGGTVGRRKSSAVVDGGVSVRGTKSVEVGGVDRRYSMLL